MRYLIGDRHRRIILEHLPTGGRLLEFGSGTTTAWLAEHLPEGAGMLSVEHDPAWADRVRGLLPAGARAELVVREPTAPLGPNASHGEERPDLLKGYIHAADAEAARHGPFDVILVDGVARDACLEHARSLLAPGGTVFLHDAQRPWYDRGKQTLVAHGHAGMCPDYPGPHLWWGGSAELEQPVTRTGELPLIVSYYTEGTPYEDEARALVQTLDALGLDYRLEALPARGSWIENCGRKARVIQRAWRESGRGVLWLDADARMHAAPRLLADTDADFAIRCFHGWAFGTGTCYFNQTPLAGLLLDDWLHRVETEPTVGEQIHLDMAWESLSCRAELRTLWLPPSYATIFDEPGRAHIDPVIEHFQASRRLASEQRTEDRVEVHHTAARTARLARRPREELVAHTWKHADAPQPSPAPGFTALPESIKHGLLDRLALELFNAGIRTVAVYGAGRLTRELTVRALAQRGLEVAAVVDDADRCEAVAGLAVGRPESIVDDERIEAVVLSSDAFEVRLASRAATVFEPIGLPVYRVFDWQRGVGAPAMVLRAG
ncbi:MAG: class I SAM-dependent methyltransferase [Phycisphaerales bacterium]